MVFPPSSSPSRSVRSADTPVVPRQSDWTSQKGRFSEVFPTFLAPPLLLISNQTADDSAARAARGNPSMRPIANPLSSGPDYHIALQKTPLTFLCSAIYGSMGRAGGKGQHNRRAAGRDVMVKNIDDIQKLGKDNVDATLRSLGALSKSLQAITVEFADYSKNVFEQTAAATEKLIGAKSFEKAIEVQSDYARSSYESFVAQATKLGELYADLAREAYKPFEAQFGKMASPK